MLASSFSSNRCSFVGRESISSLSSLVCLSVNHYYDDKEAAVFKSSLVVVIGRKYAVVELLYQM